jgi:hypothetical protein
MIVKEYYKTREDGVELYKTYSDIDHKIKNTITGQVVNGFAIDVSEKAYYEELEEPLSTTMTFQNAVNIVREKQRILHKVQSTTNIINRMKLTNEQSLDVKELYPTWESYIGKTIRYGFITLYNGNLWKSRQTHVAQEVFPPNINTASLYEVVVKTHEGTAEDPIPYTPPMEIFSGKYYSQDDIIYLCTRDS